MKMICMPSFSVRECGKYWEAGQAANFINILSIQNSDNVNDYFAAAVSDQENKWEAFLMICWSLWLERNRIAHANLLRIVGRFGKALLCLLHEFKDAHMSGNAHFGSNINPLAFDWQPPPNGFVKLNCMVA